MLYDKVIKYCQKNNMSHKDFERLCGLGNGAVSKWQISKPTLNTLEKIATATKTQVKDWL